MVLAMPYATCTDDESHHCVQLGRVTEPGPISDFSNWIYWSGPEQRPTGRKIKPATEFGDQPSIVYGMHYWYPGLPLGKNLPVLLDLKMPFYVPSSDGLPDESTLCEDKPGADGECTTYSCIPWYL
jgi:hypothetical protein